MCRTENPSSSSQLPLSTVPAAALRAMTAVAQEHIAQCETLDRIMSIEQAMTRAALNGRSQCDIWVSDIGAVPSLIKIFEAADFTVTPEPYPATGTIRVYISWPAEPAADAETADAETECCGCGCAAREV